MLYIINIHPALATLRAKISWRSWEMLNNTLVIDEEIRLEKLMADGEPLLLGTGKKEGTKRIYTLEKAREYTLEYSASLAGRGGERDFLFLDASSELLPQVETRLEQEVVLSVPQSYSALSSLKKDSISREEGLKRYRFVGEGKWCLALARYFELSFLSGKILLLEDTGAVLALRALEEATNLLSERMGGLLPICADMASIPDKQRGIHTPGGIFVEKRAFTQMDQLPLLLDRFFDVYQIDKNSGDEFVGRVLQEYLMSETLKRVLSSSQYASLGLEESSLLSETRKYIGAEVFDKLLQLILKKAAESPMTKEDFIRQFDELSWKPGTGDFLKERIE